LVWFYVNEQPKPRTRRTLAAILLRIDFSGHWSSPIIYASGEVSDGTIDISDVLTASANRVSLVHSFRGGPFTGYIMSYPDRIEIQMPLGDGRVAHYNGILMAVDRIEGRFFVTGDRQSHHSHKRSESNRVSGSFAENEGGLDYH